MKRIVHSMFHSFVHAFHGLCSVYGSERNFRIQVRIGILVIFSGVLVGLGAKEWVIIVLVITLVLLLELLNTVVERMIDVVKPKIHDQVRIIKDVMAAAVFVAGIASVVVGGIIFYPYLWNIIATL